jgi:hypothetical protein
MVNTTISNNIAALYGGGIYIDSDSLIMLNSTISGNQTVKEGGAISTWRTISRLTNCTITNNSAESGGGLNVKGTEQIYNCIIAGNLAEKNIEGQLEVDINNVTTGDPKLGPLQYNGGPTYTHALLAGSPAIEGGNSTYCPGTDQRGAIRPYPPGTNCDIGAYEYDSPITGVANDMLTKVTIFPNPFTNVISILFNTPEPSDFNVAIFDLNGKLIKELAYKPYTQGLQQINWDSKDNYGVKVVNGVYFVKVIVGKTSAIHKIIKME